MLRTEFHDLMRSQVLFCSDRFSTVLSDARLKEQVAFESFLGSIFMHDNTVIDYLILGHVTKDVLEEGYAFGGTCSYAGLTAQRLGQQTAMVTSAAPDLLWPQGLCDVQRKCIVSADSTTFENIYDSGVRHQRWLNSAAPIRFEDVPLSWRSPPIVHLAPIAQELSPVLCSQFPDSLVGVTLQGWLRGRDAESNVTFCPHEEVEPWLPYVDVVVLSLADVQGDSNRLLRYVTAAKIGVETLGPEGCRLYMGDEVIFVPTTPQPEVDPTGAGDIFAAAFLTHYRGNEDPVAAARFANACASLSLQAVGLDGVPTLDAVLEQLGTLYPQVLH